jgi:hypothetical protein
MGRSMILRAAFWIVVVAVFVPHEPDLGFGPQGILPPKAADWISQYASPPSLACEDHTRQCPAGLELAADLRSTILSNLGRVRAELKEQARLDDQRRRSSLAARIPQF